MYTWLPYPNLKMTREVLRVNELEWFVLCGLDALRGLLVYRRKELGSVELMWQGYEACLLFWVVALNKELEDRGENGIDKVKEAFTYISDDGHALAPVPPPWMGEPRLHLAHRSNLIRIAPEHYAQLMPPNTPLELPMYWPKGNR